MNSVPSLAALRPQPSESRIQAVHSIQTLYHNPLLYQTVLFSEVLFKITPGQLTHPPNPWKSHTFIHSFTSNPNPVDTQTALFIFALLPQSETPADTHQGNHVVSLKCLQQTWIWKKIIPPFLSDRVDMKNGKLKDSKSAENSPSSSYFISLPNLRSYSLIAGYWQKSFHNPLAHPDGSNATCWRLGFYCNGLKLGISTKRKHKSHLNVLLY